MVLYSYYTEFCPFTQEICPCVFFLICYTDSIINEYISKGILSEILRKNRAEVIDMILTEYDENEFLEFLKILKRRFLEKGTYGRNTGWDSDWHT